MNDQQAVLFVGNDLMFFSKVSSAANQAGFRGCMVKSADSIAERFQPEEIGWVILDLFQLPTERICELVTDLRACCGSARIIGFGPHVDGENLDAARLAGLDAVMTRGQLHRSLPELFLAAN
jgi:hypothetical protein